MKGLGFRAGGGGKSCKVVRAFEALGFWGLGALGCWGFGGLGWLGVSGFRVGWGEVSLNCVLEAPMRREF